MFVLFFLFWVMLNGRITVEITLFGLVISAAMYVFVCKFTEFSFRKDMWIVRKLPWIIGAGPGAFSYGFKDPYSTGPSGKFDYPDTRHDHCRDEGWRIPDSLL